MVRVIQIALSYVAASLMAGLMLSLWLFFAFRFSSGEALQAIGASEQVGLLIAFFIVSSEFAAVLALGPALPAIVYSERRHIQSFWFYAYGGALIGLFSLAGYYFVMALPKPTELIFLLRKSLDFPAWGAWLLATFSGFISGAVYWSIAGRNAGAHRGASKLK